MVEPGKRVVGWRSAKRADILPAALKTKRVSYRRVGDQTRLRIASVALPQSNARPNEVTTRPGNGKEAGNVGVCQTTEKSNWEMYALNRNALGSDRS